jgi:hypothetical protein
MIDVVDGGDVDQVAVCYTIISLKKEGLGFTLL